METLAAIPYTTFPEIDLGPVTLHTFGVMVAIGMMVGIYTAATYAERRGISRDFVYSLGIRMILWGVVGARVAWVVTHTDQLDGVVDIFAVWKGGLTFTGGFIAGAIVAVPYFRRLTSIERWYVTDAIAIGLTLGQMIGRIGCYAVGEHLGGPTTFFLGTRYDGGVTREGPLVVGQVIHNTSLYEFLHLAVLAVVLLVLLRVAKRLTPGTLMGVFCIWYGVARFGTDFLRTYDETLWGLTAAQFLCIPLLGIGIWILVTGRKRRAALRFDATEEGTEAGAADEELPGGAAEAAGRPGQRFQALGGYAVATGVALAVAALI
ncbi:MAG: prolipoprotein diacylglyceryl transferase [Actinobacteria bacterium]|nr:prolipoprotein diacylglyceryl transferase [Actinomycetota bacterium]